MTTRSLSLGLAATFAAATIPLVAGCPANSPSSSSTPVATVTGYKLIAPSTAMVGDAVQLQVQEVLSTGATASLPSNATITWNGAPTMLASSPAWLYNNVPARVSALSGNVANTTLLATDSAPTGFFVSNPARALPDPTILPALADTLFISGDPASASATPVVVSATIGGTGVTAGTTASASISITAGPSTVSTSNGGTVYAANCAMCHGATGDGAGTAAPNAPGLNNLSPGGSPNLAADPGWNAPLLAFAARADVDNTGSRLYLAGGTAPMPFWLTQNAAGGGYLTTQDYYDMYAWLKTQTN